MVHDTRHICAFFNDEDEEYRVLLPFINEGLATGDKAIHVVGADHSRDHLQRLALSGIDAGGATQRGQLEVRRDLRNRRAPEDASRRDGAM
jgi:hypothetical protein